MKFSYILPLSSYLFLTACHTPVADHGQYWQRASVSDAAYQQGPKAQQMLDRDIARCVTELREMERLGAIQNALPSDMTRQNSNIDEERLRAYDDPNRDGYLFAENKPYYNFETCMDSKGWDRVASVPYDVADRAQRIRDGGETQYQINRMRGYYDVKPAHTDYDVNE